MFDLSNHLLFVYTSFLIIIIIIIIIITTMEQGSWVARSTKEHADDPSALGKDMDLKRKLKLDPEKRKEILSQIEADVKVLIYICEIYLSIPSFICVLIFLYRSIYLSSSSAGKELQIIVYCWDSISQTGTQERAMMVITSTYYSSISNICTIDFCFPGCYSQSN